MLAVAGLASLADAAHPMGCAPSVDAACRAEQDTPSGLLHQVTEAHTTSSLVGFVAIAGAMVLLGIVTRPKVDDAFRRFTIACLVVTGLTGIADVVLILTQSAVGFSERARILVFAVWLCGLGLRCLPSARWSSRPAGAVPAGAPHPARGAAARPACAWARRRRNPPR